MIQIRYHLQQIQLVFGDDVSISFIASNEDFSLNFQNIEENFKKNGVDLLVISNPSNPSGVVYNKVDIDRLLKITADFHSYVSIPSPFPHFHSFQPELIEE